MPEKSKQNKEKSCGAVHDEKQMIVRHIKWTKEACFDEAKKYNTRKDFQKGSYQAYKKSLENGWLDNYTWFVSKRKRSGYWKIYENCLEEAKKYTSMQEFWKANPTACRESKKHGYITDFTWLKKQLHAPWNKNTCRKEAKKYSSRLAFGKGSRGAYKVAVNNGWINDYDWFDTKPKHNFWNSETCYEEALKYHTRSEFAKHSPGAYHVAKTNNWLDNYEWLANKRELWTQEGCFSEAKKYKSITEFANANTSAYQAAQRNCWLDDYVWMERRVKPRGYWNYERCKEYALKYKKKVDFQKGSPSAYAAALKNGWISDYVWFLSRSQIKEYYVYAYEFVSFKTVYVGLTKRKEKRDAQHHGKGEHENDSPVFTFSQNNNISVPDVKYWYEKLTAKESQEKEDYILKKYIKDGWTPLNSAATGAGVGSLGGTRKIWTKNIVCELAKKYTTARDFKNNCPSAYIAARRYKWLKEMDWLVTETTQTGRRRLKPLKWNYEVCIEVAKDCNSRSEFKRKNASAYFYAHENGWIDSFTWLKRPAQKLIWNHDSCLEEAKKYKSKIEYRNKARGAYCASVKNGWIDEYTWFVNPNIIWTYEKCYEESQKYSTKTEFRKANSGSYIAAWKNGWLDEFFPKKKNK